MICRNGFDCVILGGFRVSLVVFVSASTAGLSANWVYLSSFDVMMVGVPKFWKVALFYGIG